VIHRNGREVLFSHKTLPIFRCSLRSPGSTRFFLADPDVAALIKKGHSYSLEDQKFVIKRERELLGKVFSGARRGGERGAGFEISTSAFYHPILPLVCDTNVERFPPRGCRCRRIAFAIPRMPANNYCVGWTCTRRSLGCGPRGCGPPKAAFPKRCFSLAQNLGR